MNTRISRSVCLFLTSFCVFTSILGRPVIPTPIEVTQPNGERIRVKLIGDEFGKLTLSEDGYVLLQDNAGFYRFSHLKKDGTLKRGIQKAKNTTDRNLLDRMLLQLVPKGTDRLQLFQKNRLQSLMALKDLKKKSASTVLRSPEPAISSNSQRTLFPASLSGSYPKSGRPKTLVILANYNDSTFKPENTHNRFDRQLNEIGYNENGHVGSVRDYYRYNSLGIFDPEFVVVGPITVPQNMAYYGSNSTWGKDINAHLLIRDACMAVDQEIDFSEFDMDGDSLVDNVYVFYAGKGEADGGNQNTIHPHSSNMQYYLPNFELDGMRFDYYSCSNELNGVTGEMAGIGAFTHEYGHVVGLFDFYDTDYEDNGLSFDLNFWSLMSIGSYNNDSKVPPCLSVVERTFLGWTNPVEPDSLQVNFLLDFGSSNHGFVLPTNNPGEFFMLENRQQDQNVWDQYLPHHGMLVYHVDARENDSINILINGNDYKLSFFDIWSNNLVNSIISHSCCDLEEADNHESYWDIRGDVFPGSKNIQVFNDYTKPSSKTWNGESINKGISQIEQVGNTIQFRYKDYSKLSSGPSDLKASEMYPVSFRASWKSVLNASHYEVTVYTSEVNGDSIHMYPLSDYTNKIATDTVLTVWVDSENKTYWFQVRAIAPNQTSPYSELFKVKTILGETVAQSASKISPFTFRAHWQSRPYALGYLLDVFSVQPSGDTVFVDGYKNRLVSNTFQDVIDVNHLQTYYYRVRMRLSDTYLSKFSNTIAVSTVKPSVTTFYIKDNMLYIKGMDKGSRLELRSMDGLLIAESTTPYIKLEKPGMYVASFLFNGKEESLKFTYK